MAKGQVKRKKTDATVRKLEDALKWGNTRESACAYAWIWRTTFYQWLEADKNFRTRVEDCEEYRIHIVEDQKRKLVEKGYRPTIEKELKSKTILMGFGLDSDAIHSPNEHFGIFNYLKGIETIPLFYKYFVELNK